MKMFSTLKAMVLSMFALMFGLMATASHAAIDAGVTTALSDASTDVKVVGLAVFVIAIAIVLYKWFKRAL